MNSELKFGELKKTILLTAQKYGLSKAYLQKNWDLDYSIDFDKKFKYTLKYLNEEMTLLPQAIKRDDFVTAISAIVLARTRAFILRGFFRDIYDDLERLLWGKELAGKWPPIPEDLKDLEEAEDFKVSEDGAGGETDRAIKFEEFKKTIVLTAQKHGFSREYLQENWAIDYDVDLDKKFDNTLNHFNKEVALLSQAIQRDDFAIAKGALIRAKNWSQILKDFFSDLFSDIERLMWGDEFEGKWPSIPEDFEVPADYDYENTNKPFGERVDFSE